MLTLTSIRQVMLSRGSLSIVDAHPTDAAPASHTEHTAPEWSSAQCRRVVSREGPDSCIPVGLKTDTLLVLWMESR